eukprot:gb/GFBE01076691.1/.p1 GENE.gb/GFBE01076691.1/~~gb/GFBE01076691.1/.p1  ORF type:complete len:450 (+),score=74.84 gb/GFBE01076691.1/:1-1350(+)
MALRALLATAASFGVAAAVAAESEPLPQHGLLRYDVDLEAEPKVRYAHVLADVLRQRGPRAFVETFEGWQIWLKTALPELFGTSDLARKSQGQWLATLNSSHPDAVAEVQTLAAALQDALGGIQIPNLELPALATAVSLYPILNIAAKNTTDTRPSACTSTLARQADGTVLHGRSLDYEPRDQMAQASVVLDFHRRGEHQYRCLNAMQYPTALAWFTCVRPGAFSLSVNARSQGVYTEHNASFDELLRRVAEPTSLLLGELAERAMGAESYEQALAILASSPSVSSNYFILAGAQGQGAIVTRFGNESAADVWSLGSAAEDWSDGQPPWLRVQTNVDHWVPMSSGAYATHRRQHAIDLLSKTGQHALSKETLLSVYLTTTASEGSENRTTPEDTGVILRPSTIATLVMDPSAPFQRDLDPEYWRIWSKTPTIAPPAISLDSGDAASLVI